MTEFLYFLGAALMVLGLIISLVGYILTKRGGPLRWKHWAVGVGFIGAGLALQMALEA